MATFISDANLTVAAKVANTQYSVALPAHWASIITMANIRAYNKLRAILLGRRYSSTQFLAWGTLDVTTTDGYDWNMRLGVLYAFLEASKGDSDRGAAYRAELKELLEELAELPIVIGNELAPPSPGGIGYGDISPSVDRFVLDDPDGSGDFSAPTGTVL